MDPSNPKAVPCELCGILLTSQITADMHYLGKAHAKMLRKKLGTADGSADESVTQKPKNTKEVTCDICHVTMTSQITADAHFFGKVHAKKLRMRELQDSYLTKIKANSDCSGNQSTSASEISENVGNNADEGYGPTESSLTEGADTSLFTRPCADEGYGPTGRSLTEGADISLFCRPCNTYFNSASVAKQHYDGKTHRKKLKRKYVDLEVKQCELCCVELTSSEMAEKHFAGKKHNKKMKMANITY